MSHTLIVIAGPTGSGKTELAIRLARHLKCHIISADSRQIYRGLPICTAAPTPGQLAAAPHHMVGMLDLHQYYSAAQFETDVMQLLTELWKDNDYAILCGGSMMYIDAVVYGMDQLPTVSAELRTRLQREFAEKGIEWLQEQVQLLDPTYYAKADTANHKRLIHALELTLQSGRPYSSLLTGRKAKRPFNTLKFALLPEREVMMERINSRVDAMVSQGLEAEVASVAHLRHLNSLNTVGVKEMLAMMDGTMSRSEAIARMAKNTRVYAKKQLTWIKRDGTYTELRPKSAYDDILLSLT